MLPQYLYLLLVALGLGISIEKHGKPKSGEHSFWLDLFSVFLGLSILYWGGFFRGMF